MRSAILLLLGTLSFLGCGSRAPKLTFCVIDGKNIKVYCQDPEGKQFDLSIEQAHKFIAQPPADAQKLRDYVIGLERQVANCH